MRHSMRLVGVWSSVVLLLGACAGSAATEPAAGTGGAGAQVADPTGVRIVSPAEGATIQNDPPPGLVILDVRTSEEFAGGHLESATMLDFYAPDFGDQLAELDPEAPYLLYCRSGNRSGQTRELMVDLGFTDVADVEGGIVAWTGAGFPVVAG